MNSKELKKILTFHRKYYGKISYDRHLKFVDSLRQSSNSKFLFLMRDSFLQSDPAEVIFREDLLDLWEKTRGSGGVR
jgi:hypothetical protein